MFSASLGRPRWKSFDALHDAKEINFVGVNDERTGTHMAGGYAPASGETGVVLAGQNGPGTTNLVTGLAQAKAAYTPITNKTWTKPSTDRVPELVQKAFRVANAPRKGPVQLNLPRDVLSGQAPRQRPCVRTCTEPVSGEAKPHPFYQKGKTRHCYS
ncbi:thiamine pyrophosphate-binding protein [Roseovarius sp. TE539]|uniref:thiamine pyrophosphate-binding protein n=1 Tax=Roseovarius sp. TE539 TaxID=2249812 RepID=UPI00215C9817|nr:thiamine pyrophosphate-binding protein [Roseovarius sp. TE539]